MVTPLLLRTCTFIAMLLRLYVRDYMAVSMDFGFSLLRDVTAFLVIILRTNEILKRYLDATET